MDTITKTQDEALRLGQVGAAPTEAERELFEIWMRGHCWKIGGEWDGKTYVDRKELNGWPEPHAMLTRQLWAAWRDRAALAKYDAQPVQQALQPLSDEQIIAFFKNWRAGPLYVHMVREAERHHGITETVPIKNLPSNIL